MRKPQIERNIGKKITAWLDTIEDAQLRKAMKEGIIVTGGAVASLLIGETPNDYDVYFRTSELAFQVANYYVKQAKNLHIVGYGYSYPAEGIRVIKHADGRVLILIKSQGVATVQQIESEIEYQKEHPSDHSDEALADLQDKRERRYRFFETIGDSREREAAIEGFVVNCAKQVDPEPGEDGVVEKLPIYSPIFFTSNAITLSGGIQIVVRFTGEPAEIHQTYDFEHCKGVWCSWRKQGRRLSVRKGVLASLLQKTLHYTGSRYPLASLFRLRKFQGRGWNIPVSEQLKIAMQINELNLSDPAVLMDQLIGMDVAYFIEVINRIREEGIGSVTSTYLARIVDEVYGDMV